MSLYIIQKSFLNKSFSDISRETPGSYIE